MKKMENWKDIDTEPTKMELLKEAAIMFVVIPWKIIWFFLRPILIIATIFLPGTSSIFFGADNYKEEIIPDYDYVSVAFWVNDSANNWTLVVNSSDLIYENNATVSSLTMNPFKENATGWYFGINDSGFFEGNIDTIKFYNDTMNETQVSELFADGR